MGGPWRNPLSQGGEESPQSSLEQALAKTVEQNHELHESLGGKVRREHGIYMALGWGCQCKDVFVYVVLISCSFHLFFLKATKTVLCFDPKDLHKVFDVIYVHIYIYV